MFIMGQYDRIVYLVQCQPRSLMLFKYGTYHTRLLTASRKINSGTSIEVNYIQCRTLTRQTQMNLLK